MLITVKKQVETEETIEVKAPCWLVDKLGFYAHITEGGDLIQVYGHTITLMEADDWRTQYEISRVLNSYHGCTEAEFKEQLDKRLFKLQETYTRA
jgi:hypothetical protein